MMRNKRVKISKNKELTVIHMMAICTGERWHTASTNGTTGTTSSTKVEGGTDLDMMVEIVM